jgi:transposase InsO family protein
MKTVTDTLDVSRSQQYVQKAAVGTRRRKYSPKEEDAEHLPLIRQIIEQRPTYGYRRVAAIAKKLLRREGKPVINHKRMYRIMKAHGLLLSRYTGRPTWSHEGTVMTEQSNQRWCSDIFEVRCNNCQRVRVSFSMDCCDREVLSYVATTGGISGDMVEDLMIDAVENRFGSVDNVPGTIEWLSDNGSPYTATDTREIAQALGFDLCTTPYRSPESNGMAEAFVKTFKRDYVRMHAIPDAIALMQQLPEWFDDYNENHPHKALKMMSPREFRRLSLKLEACPV